MGDGARRELYRDRYISVHLEREGQLLRLARTATPYADLQAVRDSFAAVIAAFDRVGRKGRTMLFDTRAPIGRNDPEFEQVMAGLRPRIDAGFLRIGVLVRSAVGALQLRRWVSNDGVERIVTTDEDELLRILFPPGPG
ncbi:MAG TPA: hypothetical protein PKI03_11745 [Pseudomonadota bacterium]|nr:hypothetical protein [Pseudomonadota bacterium]